MKHKLEYLPIGDLTPYPNNPRINDESVALVANSIKEFGFQSPIIVDKDYVIIAGHTRYQAAQSLGMDEVPVIVAKELSEEQARAYRLADNKVGELSVWDFELLEMELADLDEAFDMSDFGFGLEEEDEKPAPDLGGKEEPRCECPNCHHKFFLSEGIIRDEDEE